VVYGIERQIKVTRLELSGYVRDSDWATTLTKRRVNGSYQVQYVQYCRGEYMVKLGSGAVAGAWVSLRIVDPVRIGYLHNPHTQSGQ
jgi:hypothetical protein